MKNTILIFSFLLFSFAPNHLFAQDLVQHPVNDSIELQAKNQANELMKSLGLTTKQTLLVEDKLTEFLVYKKKIVDSELPADQKTEKLKNLLSHKYSEMHEILTQYQYDLYVKMK